MLFAGESRRRAQTTYTATDAAPPADAAPLPAAQRLLSEARRRSAASSDNEGAGEAANSLKNRKKLPIMPLEEYQAAVQPKVTMTADAAGIGDERGGAQGRGGQGLVDPCH